MMSAPIPGAHPMRRALSTLLIALGAAAAGLAQDTPPTPVRAVRAQSHPLAQREAVTGNLRAAQEATLAAREEGAVITIARREGDRVERGDVLVVIDGRRLEAELLRSRAAAAAAAATQAQRSAEFTDAVAEAESLEAAAGREAVSARELRRAQTARDAAKAALDAAKEAQVAAAAEVEVAQIRVEDATLWAPFGGVVVAVHVEVGEWASPGDALVELVSTQDLEVWLDVPQRFMSDVQELGGTLELNAGGGGLGATAVSPKVIPRVDPSTRTFPLRATVEGDAGAHGLSPGMSVTAWLPIGAAAETLTVPKDAIVYRPGGIAVMVVAGPDEGGSTVNGVASLVPVRILFETDRDVAIAPGALGAGAVVITEGNERLFPGTPVAADLTPSRTPADR